MGFATLSAEKTLEFFFLLPADLKLGGERDRIGRVTVVNQGFLYSFRAHGPI